MSENLTEKKEVVEVETQKVETTEDVKKEIIEELKQKLDNSVSKEEYQKVLEENRELYNDYIKNGGSRVETVVEDNKNSEFYRGELLKAANSNGSTTNMDFWKTSLNHRDKLLEEKGIDVWSNDGVKTKENDDMANTVKTLIEESRDANDFNNRLSYITIDSPEIKNKIANRGRR